jgi:hypothetical protein
VKKTPGFLPLRCRIGAEPASARARAAARLPSIMCRNVVVRTKHAVHAKLLAIAEIGVRRGLDYLMRTSFTASESACDRSLAKYTPAGVESFGFQAVFLFMGIKSTNLP